MAIDPADHASNLAENASQSFKTASEQAQDMAQRAAHTAREAGASAWQTAEKARGQAGEVASEAYDRGERAARELMRRAEAQPLAALLIAGAVGYATAYLVHGRRAPGAIPRRPGRDYEIADREKQEFRRKGGRAVGKTDSVVDGHLSGAAGSTQEARGGRPGDVRPRLGEHAKELADQAGTGASAI